MPRKNLTDVFVKSAKCLPTKNGNLVATEYLDTKEAGLSLRVTPNGIKSWTYRYRLKSGHQRRVSLGKADVLSVADARRRVKKYKVAVDDGHDPAAKKAIERKDAVEIRNKETIKDIGDWYFHECEMGRHKPNLKRPKKASTIELEKGYFGRHIAPTLGSLRAKDLPRAAIQEFINNLSDNVSLSAAQRCKVILNSIYTFAQRNEITDRNPCQHVSVGFHEARQRVLTNNELKTIWNALEPPISIAGTNISQSVGLALLLCLVTLQRRGEVAGMSLSEINFDKKLWTIPANRTKNSRTQVVPLSDLALQLIEQALTIRIDANNFVFPSPKYTSQPIKAPALTRAFGRMKHALSLEDMRPHDLRRTGATNLTGEHLGITRFVVSKVLNHTSDTGNSAAVTGVYDQNEYLVDKRNALDAWADYLMKVLKK